MQSLPANWHKRKAWIIRTLLEGAYNWRAQVKPVLFLPRFYFTSHHLSIRGLAFDAGNKEGISEPVKAGRLVDPKNYRAWYRQMLVEKCIPFWPYAALGGI